MWVDVKDRVRSIGEKLSHLFMGQVPTVSIAPENHFETFIHRCFIVIFEKYSIGIRVLSIVANPVFSFATHNT